MDKVKRNGKKIRGRKAEGGGLSQVFGARSAASVPRLSTVEEKKEKRLQEAAYTFVWWGKLVTLPWIIIDSDFFFITWDVISCLRAQPWC